MNAAIEAGLAQIKAAGLLDGYLKAIEDVRTEVYRIMKDSPDHSTALWAVMGGLSRLQAQAPKRIDGDQESK